MNHSYAIIEEINLIVQHYQGEMTLNDAKDLKLKVVSDPAFKADSTFIIDCRLADIKLTHEEIDNLCKFISSQTKLSSGNRLAIITDNPNQVFKSTLFSINPNVKHIAYQVFSTITGAVNWLNINSHNTAIIEKKIYSMAASRYRSHSFTSRVHSAMCG